MFIYIYLKKKTQGYKKKNKTKQNKTHWYFENFDKI
jgi:hypothetical protein